MEHPGPLLLRTAAGAKRRLLIVAPYIKENALNRLLEVASPDLEELICVARWLPQDIAAGVCDLGIYDALKRSPNHHLLVHPHLHAKYYRADDTCLIGSANITSRALGWVQPGNLELLIAVPAQSDELQSWEEGLLATAVPATAEMRDRIQEQAEKLSKDPKPTPLPEVQGSVEISEEGALHWVPSCPAPERLWEVYNGGGEEDMNRGAREAALEDLAALAPPPSMTEDQLNAYVAGALSSMPLIQELDERMDRGLTDPQAHELLENLIGDQPPSSPQKAWSLLKRWLHHFFPGDYILETHQTVMSKGSHLGLK